MGGPVWGNGMCCAGPVLRIGLDYLGAVGVVYTSPVMRLCPAASAACMYSTACYACRPLSKPQSWKMDGCLKSHETEASSPAIGQGTGAADAAGPNPKQKTLCPQSAASNMCMASRRGQRPGRWRPRHGRRGAAAAGPGAPQHSTPAPWHGHQTAAPKHRGTARTTPVCLKVGFVKCCLLLFWPIPQMPPGRCQTDRVGVRVC